MAENISKEQIEKKFEGVDMIRHFTETTSEALQAAFDDLAKEKDKEARKEAEEARREAEETRRTVAAFESLAAKREAARAAAASIEEAVKDAVDEARYDGAGKFPCR